MLEDILAKWNAKEVEPMHLYSNMFKLGDHLIQRAGEENPEFKSNPLGYWKNNDEEHGHYRIMFEDTFEESLREMQEADFSIINGVTYFGRKNLQAKASKMFALIFDLDGQTDETLNNFLSGAIKADAYPVPNYIILSGHGIHLYYLFEDAVNLYPNIKTQMKNLKYGLTDILWNGYTSEDKNKQFQGINQGFRPAGGKTKIEGKRVRAFYLNEKPFTVQELGEYVLDEYKVDTDTLWKESKTTLEEAKKLYPEWYYKTIEQGDHRKGHWTCKRDLYDWWKKLMRVWAKHHHRYFCVMMLAIYGIKSGIELEEVRKDAYDLIPFMNDLAPDYPFTETDVESALECFDLRYCTFPIDDISRLSGVPIEKNRRKGQKQKDHLEEARAIRDIRCRRRGVDWRNKDGRPTKESIVRKWQEENPEGKKASCIKETGLSKKTVYKHWNDALNNISRQTKKGR